MNVYGIIPARLESTRLPRKLLLSETGKPLIQHTYEAAKRSKLLTDVIVATDSIEIWGTVRSFADKSAVVQTHTHNNGTERVAEAMEYCPNADLIINIQGDEPEIDPDNIDTLIQYMIDHRNVQMGTLAVRSTDTIANIDFNRPKVVVSPSGRALYFSRMPIPDGGNSCLLHVGVYAYRPVMLKRFVDMTPSYLETAERLEQLRVLEAGPDLLYVKIVDSHQPGIDTREDYDRFVERMISK